MSFTVMYNEGISGSSWNVFQHLTWDGRKMIYGFWNLTNVAFVIAGKKTRRAQLSFHCVTKNCTFHKPETFPLATSGIS